MHFNVFSQTKCVDLIEIFLSFRWFSVRKIQLSFKVYWVAAGNESCRSSAARPSWWPSPAFLLLCLWSFFRARGLLTQPSSKIQLCVCDFPSKFMWALGCNFIKMSFFPNSRRWLQNMLKFVFPSLGLPKLCAHLSYIIFLSICGFEVMALEMLTLQVKFWAKTSISWRKYWPLVPHNWKTWKWIHGNWSLLWSKGTSAKLRPHGKCWVIVLGGQCKQTQTFLQIFACLKSAWLCSWLARVYFPQIF